MPFGLTHSCLQEPVSLLEGEELVRTAVKRGLRLVTGFEPGEASFSVRVERIDDDDFRSETNLRSVFGLDKEIEQKVVEKALLGIGGLNQRVAEMKAFNALSGFVGGELPIFGTKLQFLASALSPEARERRMQRVLEIKGLHDISAGSVDTKIDIARLMEVRKSRECLEFREWLSTIDSATDEEIKERLESIRARVGSFLTRKGGKTMRFLVGTGIGLVPGVGALLGPGAGAIDTFLLEKVFPYSGAIAFVNDLYPSIFKND